MALLKTLWGAETGTPEGGKPDLLITLLDLYESARIRSNCPILGCTLSWKSRLKY